MASRGVALVTGAARRIGRAIAEDLSAHGFAVVIHANRSVGEAEALATELVAAGGEAHTLSADLCDVEAAASLIPRAAALAGPVTLLVNNASVFENDAMGALDPDTWDRHFAIHAKAPAFLADAMVRHLPADRDGLIVNMIDQRVWRPTPNFFSYTLSKSTAWAMTRTMAQALAPRIRVNAIGPGPTLRSARQSQEDFARQTESVLLGHGPKLEEFGATVRYFWDNSSITGQMIALDGGQHLAWETADVAGIAE